MKRLTIAAVLSLVAGCATQDDINRAITDDLRHTSHVMGYAIDADLEVLALRAALLKAYAGDPKLPALEKELGTTAVGVPQSQLCTVNLAIFCLTAHL